jgi:hypothetical protein
VTKLENDNDNKNAVLAMLSEKFRLELANAQKEIHIKKAVDFVRFSKMLELGYLNLALLQ